MVVNISSVIKDLSKDVMHRPELSDRDHADRLRHQGSVTHPLDPSDRDHTDQLRYQGFVIHPHKPSIWKIDGLRHPLPR